MRITLSGAASRPFVGGRPCVERNCLTLTECNDDVSIGSGATTDWWGATTDCKTRLLILPKVYYTSR